MIDKRMPLPLDVANDYATPSGKDASIKVKLERGDRKLWQWQGQAKKIFFSLLLTRINVSLSVNCQSKNSS